ncbi:MAG: glycosyltransferase family 4 protein [Candidatus Bathyarchaeia archaeon]
MINLYEKYMASFLVVHLSLGAFGGSERVCHHVLKSLIERGQKVDLLSFEFDRNKYKLMIGEDIPTKVIIHELRRNVRIKPPLTIYKRFYDAGKALISFQKRNDQRYDFLFLTQSSSPFELTFLKNYDKAIGYVHFPEIHYEYERSGVLKRVYIQPFKRFIEKGVKNLDLIICNSCYTKEMIIRFWNTIYAGNIEVVYPPLDLEKYWCSRPLSDRANRVVYIARFIPAKRHEVMKKLAKIFPDFEFVCVGSLAEEAREWFKKLREGAPRNYILKPNLPVNDLKKLLQESKIYVHLMEGEHFGIAPMEALASGCITLVPEESGAKEFIPKIFRWKNEEDLKNKLSFAMNLDEELWDSYRNVLWQKLKELDSKNFSVKLWECLKKAYPQYL